MTRVPLPSNDLLNTSFGICGAVLSWIQSFITGRTQAVRVGAELVMGHFFKTQPDPTQPNPTQPIIDTWYGILGYTENFIQQLLKVEQFDYK